METTDITLAPQSPAPPEHPSTPPPPPDPEKPKLHRPRSKIARLPPPVRQRLNLLIDEGITYAEVITGLGPEGSHLTEQDVCRWYKNGFQDWIRNQIWLENTRSRLDMATDVIAEHDGPNVHLANLHIAATQLIHDLTAKGETLLAENPEAYVTVVNSIARLAREALNFQKYREACALARIELDKLRDPARKLTHEETLAIVDHLDRILGFK